MASKKKGKKQYGASAGRTVKKAMGERKRGTLRSGRSNKKVTSREQAIAIGLSEARAEGDKVPRKKAPRKTSRKVGSRKKATRGSAGSAGSEGRKKSAKKSAKKPRKKSASG